jgi:hypothetical protein
MNVRASALASIADVVTQRLLRILAVAMPLAVLALWAAGALDEVEWGDDLLTGVVITALCVAHIAAGYALPRGSTYLAVTALWFAGTVGVDLVTSLQDQPADPNCDPCVGASFGFFFVVFALPLVAAGHGLRRLDQRAAG